MQTTLLLVLAQWMVRSLYWESWPLLNSWACVTGWLDLLCQGMAVICGFTWMAVTDDGSSPSSDRAEFLSQTQPQFFTVRQHQSPSEQQRLGM